MVASNIAFSGKKRLRIRALMKITFVNVELPLMKATVSIFVDIFFEAFKNKTIAKGATVIENHEK